MVSRELQSPSAIKSTAIQFRTQRWKALGCKAKQDAWGESFVNHRRLSPPTGHPVDPFQVHSPECFQHRTLRLISACCVWQPRQAAEQRYVPRSYCSSWDPSRVCRQGRLRLPAQGQGQVFQFLLHYLLTSGSGQMALTYIPSA